MNRRRLEGGHTHRLLADGGIEFLNYLLPEKLPGLRRGHKVLVTSGNMKMPTDHSNLVSSIYAGIEAGDIVLVRELLKKNPAIIGYSDAFIVSWLHVAVYFCSFEIVNLLLDLGADINKVDVPAQTSPLIEAINARHLEMARYLLAQGADPNVGRTLISAINRDTDQQALEFVKLLVEYGADINRAFRWFNNKDLIVTPLSWAVTKDKTEIVTYLQSKGALMPE